MRDLRKDLEWLERWDFGNVYRDHEFFREVRVRMPEAIRRALEAEARVKELEAEIERLKEQTKRTV